MSSGHNAQASQLIKQAIGITEEEVGKALEVILGFYKETNKQREFLDRAFGDLDARCRNDLETMKYALEVQQKIVLSVVEVVKNQADISRDTLQALTRIHSISGRVRKVAGESQILAVNAKIQAAGAGEFSRAVQVVATEMHDLSRDIEDCSDALDDTNTYLKELVPELMGKLEVIDNSTKKMAHNIEDTSEEVIGSYSSLSEVAVTTAEEASSSSKELHERSGLLVSCLQFQDRVAQMLNAAIATIDPADARDDIGTPERYLEGEDFESGQIDCGDDLHFF